MKLNWSAWILAAAMCGAAVAGVAGRPNIKVDPINLEATVPEQFGEWTRVVERGPVVDPRADPVANNIYSQVLSRTYVSRQGYRIMLSMAYGDDQRGGLQAHRQEICYAAQGFKILGQQDGVLPTAFGTIEGVRRLTTSLGPREEPVTYWLTTGNRVIRTAVDKRIAEFVLAATGHIPDGLLYRVSSIDRDAARAFSMQQQFTAELMGSVRADARRRLSGLDTAAGVS